eukprot:MONOS_6139.1-p1 / transcript=MONOS_6139.1 / gene=MONOS_6139 / organism=Monocercomonoides_exilis_PA203 / gene_product=unspecified product / transcript_product=unspecified product / location=Mono_scaffold00189:72019-73460(+) / protein_length=285 / sequence_SO=supercontig / SO=protein_coding / is_pseudo=false
MKEFVDGKYEEGTREIPRKEKFLYLLNDLRKFSEDEQKQKIEEMNELIDEMNEDEFENIDMPQKLLKVCMPCLLKVASNKERSKEARREGEMALITLNRIYSFEVIEKEMFLNEIKEIIQYHQEHHNLTWLAYQSDKNECVDFIECITRLCRAARDTHAEIIKKCFDIFAEIMKQLQLSVIANFFLKSDAFDLALGKILQSTLNDAISCGCMRFFLETSISLKSKMANETDEAKRKVIKKETLDKMEEEGYEDAIASFHKKFVYLNCCYFSRLAKNIADYFVNI